MSRSAPVGEAPALVESLLRFVCGFDVVEEWGDAEWAVVVREAISRDVGPLLHWRVERCAPRALPEACATALAEDYCRSALANQLMLAQRDEIVAQCDAAGIRVVLLKGAALVTTMYEHPALRPMSDIDLLVRRADEALAEGALRELGYRTEPDAHLGGYHDPYWRAGAACVELHRDLESRHSAVRFDLDVLWARAVPLPSIGCAAMALHPADQLLHLCWHAAVHHAWGASLERPLPLRMLVDLVRSIAMMTAADWPTFVRSATSIGAAGAAYVALRLCSRIGASVPAEVLSALEPSADDEAVIEQVWALVLGRDTLSTPYRYRGETARHALAAAFPSPSRLRGMYDLPAGHGFLPALYLTRWRDLVRRFGRATLALLVGAPDAKRQLQRDGARHGVEHWATRAWSARTTTD